MSKKPNEPESTEQVNPVGRPPKKVELRIRFVQGITETPPRIQVLAKEKADVIHNIKVNGWTRPSKNKYTYHYLPSSILYIEEKEL